MKEIWYAFVAWIIDWFSTSSDRRRNAYICDSCEMLKEQISHERAQNKLLIERITYIAKEEPVVEGTKEPINSGFMPWRVRQQMLENESLRRASEARGKQQVKDLEKEVIGEVEEQKEEVNG